MKFEGFQVQRADRFRVSGLQCLKASIEQKSINSVGTNSTTHGIAGFQHQRLDSAFGKSKGAGKSR